jgi:hypothetical protein
VKKATLIFSAIMALILGVTTAALLIGRGNYERLRLTEPYVCPDGSLYKFSTRSVSFSDPETGAEGIGVELTIDCIEDGVVTQAAVTQLAHTLFAGLATAAWFAVFMFIWLAAVVAGWLRPSPPLSSPQAIALSPMHREQTLTHLQAGRKIEAVNYVREVTGCDLAEAKVCVGLIESEIKS